MRPTLVVLTLLIALNARSQTLQLCYKNQEAFYCFDDNHRFNWVNLSASEKYYGNGNYKIDGDTIQLNFEEAERHFDLQLNESKPNTSSQSNIEVRAISSNGTPLFGLSVALTKSNITIETDHRGIAVMNIAEPLVEDEIKIKLNRSLSSGLPIKLKGYDHVLGIVVDDRIKYRENESVKLSFKKSGRRIKLNGKSFKRVRHTDKMRDI